MTTKRKQKHLHWHPRGGVNHLTGAEHELPAHDPHLSPHDEAVFLLHIGAEVEHALMLQYLYAAYSVKHADEVPPEHQDKVRAWKRTLLGIAREEMGHLVTVQNLLRLIGGPITLDREDYPFRSDLYPFHFRLEPLSKDSLSKYILAEMPYMADMPDEIKEIMARASSSDDVPVNRIGAIYLRISHILSPPPPAGDHRMHLRASDFRSDVALQQAHWADWGNGPSVLVPDVASREQALAALHVVSEQGEGLPESETEPSHYQRFLDIYREFPEGEWLPTYAVPTDPNTSRASAHPADPEVDAGRITHPMSRLWAQLSNVHYRLLLGYLSHFLQIEGPLLDGDNNYTPRGYLHAWTFDEMRRLSKLAGKLATLPRLEDQPDLPDRVGIPFELPYTLDLPDREEDRWRRHLDVLSASCSLIERMMREGSDGGTEDAPGEHFLINLLREDEEAQQIIEAISAGEPLPALPTDFQKVVHILEDAVRGFQIGMHHNFWRDCTRDEFIDKVIFDQPLIARTADGRFDADNSNLIRALRGEAPFNVQGDSADETGFPRMPAHHPPVTPEGIEFIRKWIDAGCPDNNPPDQVGIVGEPGAVD